MDDGSISTAGRRNMYNTVLFPLFALKDKIMLKFPPSKSISFFSRSHDNVLVTVRFIIIIRWFYSRPKWCCETHEVQSVHTCMVAYHSFF